MQELIMLSSVNLNCHVTKIVMPILAMPRYRKCLLLLLQRSEAHSIITQTYIICTTSMHFILSPTQETGGGPDHVCLTSLLVDDDYDYGRCLRREHLPAVGRGAVATAFYCSHHG